jgi:hypothetical protein
MEQSAIAQSLIDAMAILATKENENAAVYAVWDYLNDAKRY